MSRSAKSVKNLYYAFVGQSFGLIISFISRMIFIKYLGNEYLGLNGLFSNILTILSLAELGVGEAITYSLYKPLSESDILKCKMLMHFYKKVYTIIGFIVLFLVILITPFLNFLINDAPKISNIHFIFLLFGLNTSISYFFSYKRNLIIADQNRYIVTFYRYLFYFFVNFFQIIFLIFTKNYIVYLILQILGTFLENFFISLKANKMYSYLNEKNNISLDKDSKNQILKNTKAMMMHKVGGIVVTSTDNILLSKFISLNVVGLYSNYSLILNALNTIFIQIYRSITASVGNLIAVESKDKQYAIFKKIDFLGFWIYSFSSICFLCLINPFIKIWIGQEFLFSFDIILVLSINYYLTGMRRSVMTFREASGLFYKDRWKAIVESFINLILSIYLVKKIGVVGIFIGTFVSSISTCVWIEPYILFKYAFDIKLKHYFYRYFKYLIITIILGFITYYCCSFVNFTPFLSFLIKSLICLILPNFVMYCLFKKSEEFLYFLTIIKKFKKKFKKNYNF